MSYDYLIILVHGTGFTKTSGKGAEWAFVNSDFVKSVRAYFNENHPGKSLKIKRLEWDGKNRETSRDAAAQKLHKKLLTWTDNDECKDAKVYIIAHSHGFRVVDLAMREVSEEMIRRIKGIVSFNAPNFVALERDFWTNLRRNLFVLISSIAALFVFALYFRVSSLSYELSYKFNGNPTHQMNAFVGSMFPIIILFLILGIIVLLAIKLYKSNIGKGRGKSVEAKNCDIPLYCVNSSGDEAWNFLNLFSTLSQVPFFATHIISTGIFFICNMLFYSIWHPEWLTAIRKNESLELECRDDLEIYSCIFSPLIRDGQISSIYKLNSYWAVTLDASFIIVASLINTGLMLIIAFVIGYGLSALVERLGLGYSLFKTQNDFFLKRKIVGIFPVGFSNQTFFDTGISSSILNHSAPYNDEISVYSVCEWIAKDKTQGKL